MYRLPLGRTPTTRWLMASVLSVAGALTYSGQTLAENALKQASIRVNGKTASFTLPSGYCEVGRSPRDRHLLDQMKVPAGASRIRNPVVFMAAPCDELAQYLGERSDMLDRWVVIRVMDAHVGNDREAFLSGMSNTIEQSDHDQMSKKVKALINKPSKRIEDLAMHPIGRDRSAFYMLLNGKATDAGTTKHVRGLMALTSLHGSPVTTIAYSDVRSKAGLDALQSVVRHVMDGLLSP